MFNKRAMCLNSHRILVEHGDYFWTKYRADMVFYFKKKLFNYPSAFDHCLVHCYCHLKCRGGSRILVRGVQRRFDPRRALSPKFAQNRGFFPLKLPEKCMIFKKSWGQGEPDPPIQWNICEYELTPPPQAVISCCHLSGLKKSKLSSHSSCQVPPWASTGPRASRELRNNTRRFIVNTPVRLRPPKKNNLSFYWSAPCVFSLNLSHLVVSKFCRVSRIFDLGKVLYFLTRENEKLHLPEKLFELSWT